AIDRTFGSALNKALRGLEQAGAGPLAEDPAWTPTFDYLAGVYGGDPDEDQVIRWIDENGDACESTRFAQRSAAPIVLRRFLAPSDSRLWRIFGLPRRGLPEATIQEATGIASWFLAEMGRSVALEGEVRIGQGIEFDYCAVQAAATLRARGWQAVMINSNPETVSTDFDASSRLYFEPLDPESVLSVIEAETEAGDDTLPAVVAYGGQTPLNLAASLAATGVPLLGSDLVTIVQAEDRT